MTQPCFDDVFSEHRLRVHGLVRRFISDPDLADDVVQETFLRAWRALPRFRGDAAVSTWLHRIAVNTALTARRKASQQRTAGMEEMEEPAASLTPESDPERRGEVVDLRARLEEALAQLPPGHRAVVVLKDVEGWSHAEIASRLGISEAAAKVRLHRAHRRLARELEERW